MGPARGTAAKEAVRNVMHLILGARCATLHGVWISPHRRSTPTRSVRTSSSRSVASKIRPKGSMGIGRMDGTTWLAAPSRKAHGL